MSGTDATDPVKALREWCAINSFLCQHVLDDLRAGKHRGEAGERFLIRDAYAAALRSLEAAPALLARIEAGEGEGVQRAIAAAERTASAVEVDATCRGWTSLENAAATACVPGAFRAAVELRAALAALRASPESVGGAAPSGRAAQAINTAGRIVREAEAERDNAQRTASSLSVELAVAAKERDALKADLAAARGEVERVARIRDAALKLLHATDAVLGGRPEDSIGPDQRGALRYARDNLGLAFSWKYVPPPATRVNCAAPGCRWDTTDPTGRCAVHRDGWAEKVTTATPPPATEAPISERALSERVRWVADYVRTTTGTCRASIPCLADEGAQILAAAERACLAPQTAEG